MGRSNKRGSRHRHRHHLPEEIIEDILVKLPVKSIIRFQSVSKSYFNLIKSSRFINKHLIENEESLFAMITVVRNTNIWHQDSAHVDRLVLSLCSYDEHKQTSDTWPVLNFELPVVSRHRRSIPDWYLVDQFNGIMCMTNFDSIIVINPTLAEVKLLPIPLAGQEYLKLVGFGYDNMTMDFKVVRVTSLRSGRQWGEVYSLRSNCWRRSEDEIPFVANGSTDCSTFFNGVVHWCVVTGREGEPFSWRILTFNLATDLFQQMEFPQGWCANILRAAPGLFVLNQESLAFVSYEYHYCEFVNVWTMNKHGTKETWTKLYSIGPLTHFSKPISFLNNHKFLYTANFSELILYDMLNHRSSVVCDQESQIPRDDPHRFLLCLEMGVCRSSLVSLNM